MTQSKDLTQGAIVKPIIALALPIIATNFMQTAYNLVDMIWIGKLGSEAVISVGTAGFASNMTIAIFALILVGTGIRVSQCFGAKEYGKIEQLVVNAYIAALAFGIFFSSLGIVYRSEIISFFKLDSPEVVKDAENYLRIVLFGTIFMYFNGLFSAIVNGVGNSKLPFRLNSIGFMINIILDPILIFGIGGWLEFGVVGAAYATVISAIIVFVSSLVVAKKMVGQRDFTIRLSLKPLLEVMNLGLPTTVQRVCFTGFGIIIARIIAGLGDVGIAVQKIGLQVEAISFMTAGALYAAVMVFVGQNYGANNIARIKKGVQVSWFIALVLGIITTSIFLIFPRQIMSVFVQDEETIAMGIRYLQIIGISQIFMCVEIVSQASFNGMGKTYIPATASLVFTGLRIPLAIYLTSNFAMGLDGVWWTISLTSIVRGILLVTLFILYMRRIEREQSL